MYHIRAAHPRDAYTIAPLLREADKKEITAAHGADHEAALYKSIADSDEAHMACRPDGHPLAIYGIGSFSDMPHIGNPWMVGTDEMLKHRKALIKDARKWIEVKLDTYAILANYMDSRNTVHLNWVQRIGFKVITHIPVCFNSIRFYPFYRSK